MNRNIALLFCLFLSPIAGISQINQAMPAPGEIVSNRQDTNIPTVNRGLEIWQETFENGIPLSWENSEVNGIAHWEYRGPTSNPDIYVGSRGSCIPDGQPGSDPIESETWTDGFAIFDSNYWDDNIGPCISGFGTGPSPAPHEAWLATPVLDFTDNADVFFAFNHFYKEWTNNTEAKVQYKTSVTDWTDLYTVTVETGNATSPNEEIVLNITEYAAGRDDFQIRFHFAGTYYYWMIDDVRFFEPDANDLAITSALFGDFDIYDPTHETGFEGLTYTMYPNEMPPYFEFQVEVFNAGAETQNDAYLTVEIVNVNTDEVVYSESSAGANMVSQQVSTFSTPAYSMPAVMGNYEIRYSITQNQEDAIPENNSSVFAFNINDVMYARDNRSTEGIYIPSSSFNNTAYEVGNMFVITADDVSVHSLSIGCGVTSTQGAEIYGAIYKLNINSFNDTELLAQTQTQAVYVEALNDFGEEKTMVIPFDEPLVLQKDSAYLVVAGVPTGPQDVVFATSGDAEPLSSWVRFFPNNWFYMVQNPMVRMNFGEVTGIEENEINKVEWFDSYPNPFSESTTIRFSLNGAGRATILVHDNLGRAIRSDDLGVLPAGMHQYVFNRNSLAPGMYTYSIIVDGIRQSQSMIIAD